jgi:endonuclease/exonuclease/phosphatase family metal-dependent hydrolase
MVGAGERQATVQTHAVSGDSCAVRITGSTSGSLLATIRCVSVVACLEEVQAMELRLGTFNVWGLPEAFSDDVSSRMRGIASRLKSLDLDVVLLQEVWTEEVRDTLRDGGLAAGFEVADASGGGLMALSRRPILSTHFERFRFRGDPERVAQGEFLGGKGFQTLTLDEGGEALSLINTHVHARYRRARPRLNSAVRTAQLLQIVEAIHRTGGSVLVGGDFNCTSRDPEYRIFSALTGAREVAEDGPLFPTLSRSNFYKRHRSGDDKRIDFLFVRSGSGERWEARDVGLLFAEPERIRGRDRSLSDHYGFQSTIRLTPSEVLARGPDVPRPDRQTFDLARDLLEVGREEADRRERTHLRYAGSWVAGAALAAGMRRLPALDRRSFLRGAATAFAGISLAPAFGYTTLARVDSGQKRDAFDDAQAVLAQLESEPLGAA